LQQLSANQKFMETGCIEDQTEIVMQNRRRSHQFNPNGGVNDDMQA